ncbi:hypothetical protein PHET_04115 [Paragonimus heterotremus]|uniref:Uncharacterized protein n=1 Tax=Paragonimus heterotremus TaxID=100268 RepID=A0A8J4SQS9_9TREM|nr:hypothetical protein PHET_04115 [Paragonimus heterotremus]
MSALLSTLYRVSAFGFFLFVIHSFHRFAFGHDDYSVVNFGHLSIYLTFVVLIIQLAYFLLATPIQLMKQHTLHSSLFCGTFAASLFVCLTFWVIYLYDSKLLLSNPDLRKFPLWFSHASHSVGVCTSVLDGYLSRPSSLSFVYTALLVFTLAGGYTVYVEYLARFKSTYPYPLVQNLSPSGRYILYGVGWIVICLCMFVAYLITRFLLVRHRPRKPAARSKPTAVKPHPDTHKGKSRKSRKAD